METLFKSELMDKCQIYLPQEAAYACVAELGELGLAQFVDLNPEMSSFQRKFVGEVKRCEEMERKLRFMETELARERMTVPDDSDLARPAPAPREMVELETTLTTVENNLKEVNTNYVSLRKNHLELTEMKTMLNKTEMFLSENQFNFAEPTETTALLDDMENGRVKDDQPSSMHFNITAGVLERSRMMAFERMLWRVSKGNVFCKFVDMDEEIEDPATGNTLYKTVFIIFFQGEELKTRVKKICDGFHASVYPCPESGSERREMLLGVNNRLEDLSTVLTQTTSHRRRLLEAASTSLRANYVKVRKMKAVYHILNQFTSDKGQVLIGECWMPTRDIPHIRASITSQAQAVGSTVSPTIEKVLTTEQKPTFNRTNKYTSGFQELINAFGCNTYREVNPAVFTIATFPFLFAVMFGDAGHGVIMLIASLFMIIREKKLEPKKEESEIFKIFFGGRYIILLMSFFSIYTGLIYNDIFSVSINLFGSHWSTKGLTLTASESEPLKMSTMIMLDPKDPFAYSNTSYPFGLDPVWQKASNKIGFQNTLKMKVSLIFGIIHMTFGVLLGLWNILSKKEYSFIFLEFLPRFIFLVFLFGYLVLMIFIKWTMYGANLPDPYSEHCAPNLLITFINMMLTKKADYDPKLEKCHIKDELDYDIYMFFGQEALQKMLLYLALVSVPVMLLGKPIFVMVKRRQAREGRSNDDELLLSNSMQREGEDETPFGELMINSGIHTIEYVLGSISHTASYLRLWALSLAHSQLSEVLWSMVMRIGLTGFKGYGGAVAIYVIFAFWAALTLSIMVLMEGLSAFLHTLRLHWVEFQSKFYEGQGYLFVPFEFRTVLKEAAAGDKDVIKNVSN